MKYLHNYVQLSGRLIHPPKLKRLSDGTYLVNLSIAIQPRLKEDDHTIFQLVGWGEQAIRIEEHFTSGDYIIVAGELRNRRMQKNGMSIYRTEVLIREFQSVAKLNYQHDWRKEINN
ncbi:MAG: single-stranded DNA-binding protein [Bacteroidota bacterium]